MNNRFRIVKVLGSGAFGTVFLTEDEQNQEQIAVKRVFFSDADDFNKAMQEVWPLRDVKHANLVSIEHVFMINDVNPHTQEKQQGLCFGMQFFKDGDLDGQLMRRSREKKHFTQYELVSYMKQLASGVAFLHSKGIIHRDLKPLNVFVTDNEKTLKIGDFGLVKKLEKAFTSTVVGTLKYIAPEVLTTKKYQFSADVWSLAVLFIGLLELRNEKNVYMEVFMNPNFYENLTTSVRNLGYKSDIAALMCEMLQKDPDARPSAEKVLQRLNKL